VPYVPEDKTKPFRGVPQEFYQQAQDRQDLLSQTGRGTNRAENPTSVIDALRQAIANLVARGTRSADQFLQGGSPLQGGANVRPGTRDVGSQSSLANRTMTTSAPVTPNTKLDLKISSNINLMVDGRILASTL